MGQFTPQLTPIADRNSDSDKYTLTHASGFRWPEKKGDIYTCTHSFSFCFGYIIFPSSSFSNF